MAIAVNLLRVKTDKMPHSLPLGRTRNYRELNIKQHQNEQVASTYIIL